MAGGCAGTSRGILYVREHVSFDLAGETGQVDAQPAKVPLLAHGVANAYILECVCVCVITFSLLVCMFVCVWRW